MTAATGSSACGSRCGSSEPPSPCRSSEPAGSGPSTSSGSRRKQRGQYRDLPRFPEGALADGNYRAAPRPAVDGPGAAYFQHAMDIQRKGVSATKLVVTPPITRRRTRSAPTGPMLVQAFDPPTKHPQQTREPGRTNMDNRHTATSSSSPSAEQERRRHRTAQSAAEQPCRGDPARGAGIHVPTRARRPALVGAVTRPRRRACGAGTGVTPPADPVNLTPCGLASPLRVMTPQPRIRMILC